MFIRIIYYFGVGGMGNTVLRVKQPLLLCTYIDTLYLYSYSREFMPYICPYHIPYEYSTRFFLFFYIIYFCHGWWARGHYYYYYYSLRQLFPGGRGGGSGEVVVGLYRYKEREGKKKRENIIEFTQVF